MVGSPVRLARTLNVYVAPESTETAERLAARCAAEPSRGAVGVVEAGLEGVARATPGLAQLRVVQSR